MAFRQEMYQSYSTSSIQTKLTEHTKKNNPALVGVIPYAAIQIKKNIHYGYEATTWLGTYRNEQVVIKEYRWDDKNKESITKKMLSEWDILQASFPSQYVVTPIGYCMTPPLIVMEEVENGALDLYLRNNHLTNDQKLVIANDIALGLLTLLKAGIVHRDVKTANILLTNDLHAKICDFDLSRKIKDTIPLAIAGTSIYIAPEYYFHRRAKISLSAADVFSFGVVLVELFADIKIFDKYAELCPSGQLGNVTYSMLRVKMLREIVHNQSSAWPRELTRIIKDCLSAPSRRPRLAEIQQRLEKLLLQINARSESDENDASVTPFSIFIRRESQFSPPDTSESEEMDYKLETEVDAKLTAVNLNSQDTICKCAIL